MSTAGFNDSTWYSTNKTQTTVLGGLVDSGVYADPFYGKNLDDINASAFDVSWWYRAEFTVPAGDTSALLTFRGLNYRANVWVNGHQLGDASVTAGAFRYFDFDISAVVQPGARAAVAVELFRPEDNVR